MRSWGKRLGCVVAAAMFSVVMVGVARAYDTPASIAGAKTVGAEDVKGLMAKGAKVYDFRKKAAFVEKHVPGAVNGKYEEKSAQTADFDAKSDGFDLGQLPPDKNATLVFHGHGPDGWKGYKATVVAVRAGYKNVHFFRGGFAEWVAKGLPTE